MNLFTATPLVTAQLIAHALGWTLLHFLWQGALVALILACVLALLGFRSPQPRYLAACTALLLMVIAPIATFTRIVSQNRTPHSTIALFQLDPIIINATGTPSQPLLQRIAATLDHAMPIVLTLWLAGVLLLLCRLAIGLVVARRMKSVATQPPPRDLLAAFHQLARRVGVSRPVRLLNSALVQVPTVIGWLRPVVLIPLGCLAGLSPAQIEAILAHELAHIRRHDYLISVLQSTVEALLFYHPAVWWVSRRIRIEREHCCDDLAVHIGGDPLTYARALSLLAEQSVALPTLTLAATGGILTMRIKRLLTPKQNTAAPQLAAALLTLAILATGLCIGTAARAQNNSQNNPSQNNHTQNNPVPKPSSFSILTEDIHGPEMASKTHSGILPSLQQAANPNPTSAQHLKPQYEAWIDQDVRWNITPQERAAFLQLASDEERDHFIQQFWEVRNPAGTAPNSARNEHYERIAYANRQFGKTGIPGWQTDRGRIYIVNGPPSTLDSHNSEDGRPYEIWRYSPTSKSDQPIELKFVDICFCGNYQLQPQPGGNGSARTSVAPLVEMYLTVRNGPYSNPTTKAAHVSGTVVLIGMKALDGRIYDLRGVSGPSILQASAIESLTNRHFEPLPFESPAAGVPVKITLDYPIDANHPVAQLKAGAKPAVRLASFQPQPYSSKPVRVSAGVMAGQTTSRVTPIYPPEAKAAGIQGAVVLHAIISKTGDITTLEPISGPEELRESALTAVRQWKYKPFTLNGEPQEVETTITVNYHLSGDASSSVPLYVPGNQTSSSGSTDTVTPKKIGGSVSAPHVLSTVDPEYSKQARHDKISGNVLVNLWVDEQGKPSHVTVVRGVGHGLNEKAIEAIKQYKFSPALENGKPVTVALNIEVNFQRF